MGALAESFGLRQGLKYRGEIKDELLTVLRLDPGVPAGIGRPRARPLVLQGAGLFGGSNKKSEEHLRKSLTYNPNSTASHFFLAETLIDARTRRDEARAELQQVIDAPLDPDWTPGGSRVQGESPPRCSPDPADPYPTWSIHKANEYMALWPLHRPRVFF